jgi:hypothetical protein
LLPKNIAEDRIFETTYRVPLLSIKERTIRGRATTSTLVLSSGKADRGRSAAPGDEPEPAKKACKKRRRSNSSASSRSNVSD